LSFLKYLRFTGDAMASFLYYGAIILLNLNDHSKKGKDKQALYPAGDYCLLSKAREFAA